MSYTALAAGVGGAGALYALYKRACPRPIPGIPHDPKSANRLFGDLPKLAKVLADTGDFFDWLLKEHESHGGPISQVLLFPFTNPIVLVSDYNEERDVCLHRLKEFDRSELIISSFTPVLGNNQLVHKTTDEWRGNRRQVQDTMSPAFLREAAAPNIYAKAISIVDLWNQKIELGGGHPFAAAEDMIALTFDAILAVTFGPDFAHSAIQPQVEAVSKLSPETLTASLAKDEPVTFPLAPLDTEIDCMIQMEDNLAKAQNSPTPWLGWLFYGHTPSFRGYVKQKNATISNEIKQALASGRHAGESKGGREFRSAVDVAINKERKDAERENRPPDYFSSRIFGELFGFIIGGHDTTSSGLSWALKLLADNPEAQTKLRKELQDALPSAVDEARIPTAEEITGTSIPFLDATIEECFRCRSPAGNLPRTTTCDTTLLGYHLPKGTEVHFINSSSSAMKPPHEIDNSRRTDTFMADKKSGAHTIKTSDDMDKFIPERWLRKSDKAGGELVFDPTLWVNMAFGMGMRGCFGRRLAYLQFRMIIFLIIWNFNLEKLPESLSSYSGFLKVSHKPSQCFVRPTKIELAALR